MIDHLIKADTEAAMITALGGYLSLYRAASADGPAGWRGDISFPCQVFTAPTVTPQPQVQNGVDYLGNPVMMDVPPLITQNPLPDFHLWVALPTLDATLAANPACILIADRGAANAGSQSFVLQSSLTPAQMDTYTISPVMAGASYPFGSV